MKRASNITLALAILIIIPITMGLVQRWYKGVPMRPHLPRFYANPEDDPHTKIVNDTAYHIVPPFQFIDQSGNVLTEKDFEGNIFIADFIFTTCPGICPIMTDAMVEIQNKMEDKTENLMFLSHTVDPDTDTPEVMAKYGRRKGADFEKWKFATGAKEDIYSICYNGYKLSCGVGTENSTEEFDHSGRLVLVDRDRIIRGYYQGTDSVAIRQLLHDILILQMEYPTKKQVDYEVGKSTNSVEVK